MHLCEYHTLKKSPDVVFSPNAGEKVNQLADGIDANLFQSFLIFYIGKLT
jgi:hypothetical protein